MRRNQGLPIPRLLFPHNLRCRLQLFVRPDPKSGPSYVIKSTGEQRCLKSGHELLQKRLARFFLVAADRLSV